MFTLHKEQKIYTKNSMTKLLDHEIKQMFALKINSLEHFHFFA